jgi:S-DNA-T family DNA segregation ATPase FtsK/SpoIIIE
MMAHAHHYGDLVLIDGKGEEGTVWEGVARVVIEAEDILDMVDELHADMTHRRDVMRKSGSSVWTGSQLTAVVDEGQVVLAILASDKPNAAERLQRLRELSSLGRSRGVVLWWATQKPVMSGSAPGIDNLIAPNMLQRFSLRVADEQEARTALDDCAHYGPNLIPDDRSMRGHGYLKGFGPSLVRTWTMDDAAVRSLPVKQWGTQVLSAAALPNEDKVARYFLAHPEASGRQAARDLDIPESTVRKIRKSL